MEQRRNEIAVCRLLQWAAGLSAMAAPEERLQGEAALQLAVRLGLKPAAMLAVLLDSSAGIAFYHHFPAAVMKPSRTVALCRAKTISGHKKVTSGAMTCFKDLKFCLSMLGLATGTSKARAILTVSALAGSCLGPLQ